MLLDCCSVVFNYRANKLYHANTVFRWQCGLIKFWPRVILTDFNIVIFLLHLLFSYLLKSLITMLANYRFILYWLLVLLLWHFSMLFLKLWINRALIISVLPFGVFVVIVYFLHFKLPSPCSHYDNDLSCTYVKMTTKTFLELCKLYVNNYYNTGSFYIAFYVYSHWRD